MHMRLAVVLALALPARLLAQEPGGNQPQDTTPAAPDWNVNVGAMLFVYPS
jgi:hypothetical protein